MDKSFKDVFRGFDTGRFFKYGFREFDIPHPREVSYKLFETSKKGKKKKDMVFNAKKWGL